MKPIRHLFLLLTIVLALLLLVSTLAGVVAPSKAAFVSLVSLAYVPLLVTNAVVAIIWGVMWRWEALIPVAVIVLRWSLVPLFFQFGGHTTPSKTNNDESRITLLSFNVHAFRGTNGNLPAVDGAAAFVDILDKEQPDVLCLQEYSSPRKVKLDKTLKEHGYLYSCGSGNRNHGVMLFSKYRILRHHNMGNRGKVLAEIDVNGKVLTVIAVHMASYHLGDSDLMTVDDLAHGELDGKTRITMRKLIKAAQRHEVEYHNDIEKTIAQCATPLLLAGDLNDTPASYLYHQLTTILSDTYCEQGRGFITTYHGLFPAFRIDHQMHNSQLEALSYKRIKSDISDHYPLVATYRIR